jgi:hypothetical protein
MKRTNEQSIQLFALLKQSGLTEDRGALVKQFTAERTDSTKELSYEECQNLINYLREMLGQPPMQPKAKVSPERAKQCDTMRKAMLNLGYNMRFDQKETTEVKRGDVELAITYRSRVNVYWVNVWCLKYSYLKKGLNEYTYEELPKLIRQFEKVYESYLKSVSK